MGVTGTGPTIESETSGTPPLPEAAYRRMSLVLRAGLATSLAILGVGLGIYFVGRATEPFGKVVTANPILDYLSAGGLAAGLVQGRVEAYLTLGLLVLVATPFLRVATGFYYFARDGERWMAGITLVVMALLLFGLLVLGPLIR